MAAGVYTALSMGVNDHATYAQPPWLTDLFDRHAIGEAPAALYEEYQQRIAAETERDRYTPVSRHAAVLIAAWESGDWDALEPSLTSDCTHLTSEATRVLLGGWDQRDVTSQ